MKTILKSIVFILLSTVVFANESDEVSKAFANANELYKKENYEAAATKYEFINTSLKVESAELYFNLGNCYYKLDKVAPAIYNFEKALLFNPNDEVVKTNLEFAQKKAIDDIKVVPEIGFTKAIYGFINTWHYDSWAWAAVIMSMLFLLTFLGYYFGNTTLIKRIFFTAMFVFLVGICTAVSAAFLQKQNASKTKPAIVFSSAVNVKAEPKNSSDDVLVLHEGTKVFVLESLDNWKKIQLTDKTQGWIEKDAIKELK
ncbi:tetratricopeptide repeat protein [Flavobacterium sp.]|jgi:tetratricopeptide (TPR) repeat protein|uniref:tetratricopeptide repeat protein n=1 Tax=Flavobacterium sp. TaxID=239 RepID=UPI002A7F16AD|nr:tetratricopeptide repeat protein [Flavobacterium sp.]